MLLTSISSQASAKGIGTLYLKQPKNEQNIWNDIPNTVYQSTKEVTPNERKINEVSSLMVPADCLDSFQERICKYTVVRFLYYTQMVYYCLR